ncbi:MAG TPA: PAS domain-containing protein [Mesorhizobium sp.]|jgi:hypothetical protein
MQQEGTIALFQYWNRLRDGRTAPARREVEPADIKSLLADTFILEADNLGDAIFRLAGTRLCAIYDRELKGISFPSLWRLDDHHMVLKLLSAVFIQRSVAVLSFNGRSRAGRSMLFEMLLLPLDAGRDSPRCLGLVTACERAYWLGADPVVEAKIDAVRIVDPDLAPEFVESRPLVAAGAHAVHNHAVHNIANDRRSSHQPRRVRHLVVFNGGRER